MDHFEILYNLTDKKIKELRQEIYDLSFNATMFNLYYIKGLISALNIIVTLDNEKYVNDLNDKVDYLTDLALEKILSKGV